MAKKKKQNKNIRNIAIATAAILIVLVFLDLTHVINIFRHHPGVVRAPSKAVTTLPKQPASTKTANGTGSTIPQGQAVDQNGSTPSDVTTNPKLWSTSSSGNTILKAPLENATFKSGDVIYGSASGAQVEYRLIDNSVGVIAQGPINVVNGQFTAKINFTPNSSSGRLDVFNTDSSGKEINEVQVEVNF